MHVAIAFVSFWTAGALWPGDLSQHMLCACTTCIVLPLAFPFSLRGMRSGTLPTPLVVGLGAACEVAMKEMEAS